MAKGFRPVDRAQLFLLPEDMRSWLPDDHLAWLIISVVEEMDLQAFVAAHPLGGVGRRAYDPRMLLALLIYAYACGLRSSREIERGCVTDVALRVICAQDAPDHTAIARFRRRHLDAFEQVFTQVLAVCAKAGMVQVGRIAVDGTKIGADASPGATHEREWFRRQAARAAEEAEATDAAEDALFGAARGDEPPDGLADPNTRAARIRRCLEELEAEHAAREKAAAEQQAKQTARAAEYQRRADTDQPARGGPPVGVDPVEVARARVRRYRRRYGPDHRYTRRARRDAARAEQAASHAAEQAEQAAQAARDTEQTGQGSQGSSAGPRAEQNPSGQNRAAAAAGADPAGPNKPTTHNKNKLSTPRRNLTDPDARTMPTHTGWIEGYNCQFSVSGDYFIVVNEACQDTGDVGQGQPMMRKSETAAAALDAHRPAAEPQRIGQLLYDAGYFSFDNLTADGPDRLIATGKSRDLARAAATEPATGPPPTDPVQAMRHRLRTPEGAQQYKKRGATVEPVNGQIKDRIGLRRFSMRGLAAAAGELNLAAATHNLRRMHTLLTQAT